MQEKTIQRVGIVASIVGAVAGLAYLLSKGGSTVVTSGAPFSPTPGDSGGIGAGSIGIPGPPGVPGVDGSPGAAGLAAAANSAGNSGYLGGGSTGIQSPSNETLNQYFADQFFGPSTVVAPAYISNIPPNLDPTKAASGGGANGDGFKTGCGCGGGGGACGGGCCPNTPPGLQFPDGAGSCAATTITRLQRSMNKCKPGNLPAQALNMISNTQYGDNPDLNLFWFALQQRLDRLPRPVSDASGSDVPNMAPRSRFGAS